MKTVFTLIILSTLEYMVKRTVHTSPLTNLPTQDAVYLSGHEDRTYPEYAVHIRVVLGHDVLDVPSHRSHLTLNMVIVHRLSGHAPVHRFPHFFRHIYRLKMNPTGKIIMNFNVQELLS